MIAWLLCVVGSTFAQSGINNLQFFSNRPDAPARPAAQLPRSVQQFRIPTSLPNNFRSPGMPLIQNNHFSRLGFNSFSGGGNNLQNSNGLLMMFPSRAGRFIPGLALNRPAPLASVLRRVTLPFMPTNQLPFIRGRSNNMGMNLGQRLTSMNPNHPFMLGRHRTNRITPNSGNVESQAGTSTSKSSNPSSSDPRTQRIVDFILGTRGQSNDQPTAQVDPTTNDIVPGTPASQPNVPSQIGLTGNTASNIGNQAATSIPLRTKTDEQIQQEVQLKMRQLSAFLARNPTSLDARFSNTRAFANLSPNVRNRLNNMINTNHVDEATVNKRIEEALKNRDPNSNDPIVIDGGFSRLPPIVIDGGTSISTRGVMFDENQKATTFDLNQNKDLAKLFGVPQ